jgi:hypothetical protein
MKSVTHVYIHCVTHVHALCREGERSSEFSTHSCGEGVLEPKPGSIFLFHLFRAR